MVSVAGTAVEVMATLWSCIITQLNTPASAPCKNKMPYLPEQVDIEGG